MPVMVIKALCNPHLIYNFHFLKAEFDDCIRKE